MRQLYKEFFLNLDRCEDKKAGMEKRFPNAYRIQGTDGKKENAKSIRPYINDAAWRDPFSGRKTTKGEVGCILSHIKAWKTCVELDEAIIVLEDDTVVVDPTYQERIAEYEEDYDFLYLSKKYISGQVIKIDDQLETGPFYYWANAYWIKPNVAKALVEYFNHNPLIPTDEIIPGILNLHRWDHLNQGYNFKAAAFSDNLMNPFEGAFDISETEHATDTKSILWEDHMLHILTVGTDESQTTKLTSDPEFTVKNLGKGVIWEGGNMAEGPGGGQKINLVKEELEKLDDEDIVLFLDGYDTFITASQEDIMERYLGFGKAVVFSAESTCWPDQSLANLFPVPDNGVPFLNSGTYMGTVRELKRMFSAPITNAEDDQLYVQKQYLSGEYDAVLDHESYLFFCLAGAEDSILVQNNWVINTDTQCTTTMVHGNGGGYTKTVFDNLHKMVKGSLRTHAHPSVKVDNIAQDMYKITGLLTPEWCQRLINACEEDGRWQELPNDKFPGQEMRLNAMQDQSFIHEFREFFKTTLAPIAESKWKCLKMYDMRDCFVIRYSADSQTALPLHHDMSLVTFACKLTTDFEGGELNFPVQNINNGDWEAGELLMWPGQVTHPHESLAMKSGVKYGLVVWSGRDSGDGEYVG